MKVLSLFLLSSWTVSTTAFLVTITKVSTHNRYTLHQLSVSEQQREDEDDGGDDEVILFDNGNVPDFDAMMDDDDDDEEDDDDDDDDEDDVIRKPHARWSSLKKNSSTKKQRNDRVIDPRFETKQDKKRRMMMFVKTKERERKIASRVERKIPLTMRTPLSALKSGAKMSGTVISITRFGAYVDIGTECDGLLHISQISNTYFVENLKAHLTPGDPVEVTIKSLNPEKKKLHLTMLPVKQDGDVDDEEDTDRIDLDEIEIDDELWGEILRVTDYGSYVELGAQVKGFLHFMDHPFFGAEPGAHPSTYMSIGDRVRVWVSDVDRERERIKLTANRPAHLPGPRRELY